MLVQVFRAPTFQEACAQIKSAMGPGAFIIKHECVRDGSLWGWLLGRVHFEVTAARLGTGQAPADPRLTPGRSSRPSKPLPQGLPAADSEDDYAGLDEEAFRSLARRAAMGDEQASSTRDRVSRISAPSGDLKTAEDALQRTGSAPATENEVGSRAHEMSEPSSSTSSATNQDELGSLKDQVERMTSLFQQFMTAQEQRTTKLERTIAAAGDNSSEEVAATSRSTQGRSTSNGLTSEAVRNVVASLRRAEFEDGLIAQARGHLFEVMDEKALASQRAVRECVIDYVADRVKTSGGLSLDRSVKGKVVALVGPTGVGKTTTLAKLAAGLKLNFGLSVGFITIDTYRLAACDQLTQYGAILDVPVRIAFEAKDVQECLESLADKDVILVDTVGRNAKNRSEIEDIRRFLDCGRPVETHLLLSAGAKYSDLTKDLANFRVLGYERVVITKVDEAASFGTVLSLLSSTGTSVSYLTTGQNVPDDITVADARRMVTMALDEADEALSSEQASTNEEEQSEAGVANDETGFCALVRDQGEPAGPVTQRV